MRNLPFDLLRMTGFPAVSSMNLEREKLLYSIFRIAGGALAEIELVTIMRAERLYSTW